MDNILDKENNSFHIRDKVKKVESIKVANKYKRKDKI